MIHEDLPSLIEEIEDEIGDELEYEEAQQLIDACFIVTQTIQAQGGEVKRRDFLPTMRCVEFDLANGDTISVALTYQDGLSMAEVKRVE
jgi:hypothetical protein